MAYQGIVKSILGADGNPTLALTEAQIKAAFKELDSGDSNYEKSKIPDGLTVDISEDQSLAYLFDPDIEHTGKASYENVKGLLQKDAKGYYYYGSNRNFAEFNREDNSFKLFNSAASVNQTTKGQFYPFNSAIDLFDVTSDGLQSKNLDVRNEIVSHYFGLTMEVDFYQPEGGQVETSAGNNEDMEFKFSGDDDVWVFIDGVLVADLGGIHDALSFTINFATGKVNYYKEKEDDTKEDLATSSIYDMYLNAIDDNGGSITDTQGNEITRNNIDRYFRKTKGGTYTFRSGTEHTLSFYYLERGNQQSNLQLSYNLVPPTSDDVMKVDQDNKALAGVGFTLYSADENYNKKEALATFTSTNGVWSLVDSQGNPFDFKGLYRRENIQYYILSETQSLPGYRKTKDIQLTYSSDDGILEVENTWDTGAVSNFKANIYQVGDLIYTDKSMGDISEDAAKNGLIVAVPLLKTGDGEQADQANWTPIYGSNKTGYIGVESTVASNSYDAMDMRKRVAKAALYQIWYSQEDSTNYSTWNLSWNTEEERYQGILEDLPGTPDRYYQTPEDTSADLAMSYYFIDPTIFGDTNIEVDKKLVKLKDIVQTECNNGKSLKEAIDTVADQILNDFAQVDITQFNRIYGSHIYIPNALNAIAIRKIDEEGKAQQGIEFGVYHDAACTDLAGKGKTDSDGRIMISAIAEKDTLGFINIPLIGKGTTDPTGNPAPSYWIKEITAKDGYQKNESVIPVYVTDSGIYADALEADDGITTYNGLGKLFGTMIRYAKDGGVNVTLRDLILTGNDNTLSQTGEKTLKVHYGLPQATLDYGTHEGIIPVFITDVGIGYGQVTQNKEAHTDPNDAYYYPSAKKTDLTGRELSHLFTGSTTIVVRNVKAPDANTGSLKISKTVKHTDGTVVDTSKAFAFTVTVENAGNITYPTEDGRVITFKEGIAKITLKHNESMTIEGLPANANYTVVEENVNGYQTTVTGNTGTLSANQISEVSFTNVKMGYTDLTVKKTVVVHNVPFDPNQSFEFTVTLTGEYSDITGKYGDMEFVNGVAKFTLKHDESKTATGLPVEVDYKVEETPVDKFVQSVKDNNASGTLELNVVPVIEFINTRNATGGITVQKLVSGNDADTKKAFEFTVTLTNDDGSVLNLTGKYGAMEFHKGVASFTLKDGETITANGLPINIKYLVEEKDYKNDGYVTSSKNHRGNILEGFMVHVQFINTKNKKPDKPTSTPTTEIPKYPYRLVKTDAK